MADKIDTTDKDKGIPGKESKKDKRALEGRERYLDMVQKERAMLSEHGISRSTEQLLNSAGGTNVSNEDEELIRNNATGDQLRAVLPVQSWLPLSIHLIGLEEGILRIAPLHDLSERQIDVLLSTIKRSGFTLDDVETELWDRAELQKTLRMAHDLSADRCEKTLTIWLSDIDNGLLLNQFQRDMLSEALQMRASDIHITQDNAPEAPNWIKYRVDGDLIPMHLLPSDAMSRLTTLLKRDAGLNFGDRVTPKDGRFGFTWQGRSIDVRVAAGPHAQDGEKLTMRLLDRAGLKSFNDLFSRHKDVGEFMSRLLEPEFKGDGGVILLSGPTGSGKTTTLYACIQKIDRRRRHVLTIEDPIEYEIRYATQWQVGRKETGSDFAGLIRASLRHDPDYIVIGEMRDGETVETALRAAESGHTVISTIHADTAIQTLERLRSFMPHERDRASTYTMSQQIKAILNQRLIKTLCHGCAYERTAGESLTPIERDKMQVDENHKIYFHNHSGCDLCNRTGYLGRTLLLEALLIKAGQANRMPFYEALLDNVNTVVSCNGVEYHSRLDGVRHLVRDGAIDPKSALVMIDDELMG